MPEKLKRHHEKYPNALRIQILGTRGAGKSTFINKFMKAVNLPCNAATDFNECTLESEFFDITPIIANRPDRYDKVFITDQPGIGGNKITEASYLTSFGPGHFNFTFLLGEKGFNELDMLLLKHLLHNKRPMAFIRTQCDSAITGICDEYEVSGIPLKYHD